MNTKVKHKICIRPPDEAQVSFPRVSREFPRKKSVPREQWNRGKAEDFCDEEELFLWRLTAALAALGMLPLIVFWILQWISPELFQIQVPR